MKSEEIRECFEKHTDEFLKFERVKNKRSNRQDLHVFILLDELFPSDKCIIDSAEHDEIFVNLEDNQLEKLTEEQIIELIRCGARYDYFNNSLAMFI